MATVLHTISFFKGFMVANGEENANPLKMPVTAGNIHHLKEGILLALYIKETGEVKKYSHFMIFTITSLNK